MLISRKGVGWQRQTPRPSFREECHDWQELELLTVGRVRFHGQDPRPCARKRQPGVRLAD